ncbi:MSHA biogenesis protein MshJ [Gammaproteobacteria bacterium]
MKHYWASFHAYIEARQLRERVLIFAATVGVVMTLLNSLLFDPLFARIHALRNTISQHQSNIAALTEQSRTLIKLAREPLDTMDQDRLRALEHDLAQINISFNELLQHQVSSQQMTALLEDVLQHNQKLHLVALKTLPVTQYTTTPEPVVGTQPAKIAPPEPVIHKHGVEFTVESNYAELLTYLSALENLPWQFFWGDLRFSVEDYPRERITLTLYTLSIERAWLRM